MAISPNVQLFRYIVSCADGVVFRAQKKLYIDITRNLEVKTVHEPDQKELFNVTVVLKWPLIVTKGILVQKPQQRYYLASNCIVIWSEKSLKHNDTVVSINNLLKKAPYKNRSDKQSA